MPRPLGAVAVAAAAEQDAKLPAGDRPQRLQHVLQRVVGVGVIDQHGERLPEPHRLQPAGRAVRIAQAAGDLVDREPEDFAGQCRRRQQVLHVVPADERRRDLRPPVRRQQHEVGPLGRHGDVPRTVVGSSPEAEPDVPGSGNPAASGRAHSSSAFTTATARARQRLEQPGLGGGVVAPSCRDSRGGRR